MNKQIEFNLGAEKQIKISSAGHDDSLFYEAYRQALAGVVEIVRASNSYTSQDNWTSDTHLNWKNAVHPEVHNPLDDPDYYNYPNNMIVFTGGRGVGKSSAMLTFVHSLTQPDSKMLKKSFLEDVVNCELAGLMPGNNSVDMVCDLLKKCEFVSLPPIDPTMLESDEQILINILARMFQKAETVWEENTKHPLGNQLSLNERNELMHQFTVCYECASALKKRVGKNNSLDPLDSLDNLGDGSNLKRQLVQLVKKLLRFIARDSRENSYLVLQIDDTDMNIQQAYAILEDIRKYLVIPRLIIVMAADLEHLSRVVEGNLLSNYVRSPNSTEPHVYKLANQYISKLIPQSRRICLPELEVYLKDHPDTKIICSALGEKIIPDKNEHFPDSQDQIFRLIYRKTGMIFIRQEHSLHYIIPGNMRRLSHFLAMLAQMQDVADPDKLDPRDGAGFFLTEVDKKNPEVRCKEHLRNLRVRLQNVQRFRDYFMESWIRGALSHEDCQKLQDLAEANLPNKVRTACSSHMDLEQNPSYVDMLRIYQKKDRCAQTVEESRYIFAVHTLFSLLGHIIVLEELIAHYTDPEWEKKYCVFKRLYPLFGSRPFSYMRGEAYIHSEFLDDSSYEEQDVASVPTGEDLEVVMREDPSPAKSEPVRWYPIRWKAPDSMDVADNLKQMEISPRFLYSMFCSYDRPDATTDIWGDFSTPILNCLYLNPYESSSPIAEAAVTDKSNFTAIRPETWPDIQTNSLLVMLNWDVQRAIGESLIGRVRYPTDHINQGPKNLIDDVSAFLKYLTRAFHPESSIPKTTDYSKEYIIGFVKGVNSENGDEAQSSKSSPKSESEAQSGKSSPIRCLEKLNLIQWVSALTDLLRIPNSAGNYAEADGEGSEVSRDKPLQAMELSNMFNKFYGYPERIYTPVVDTLDTPPIDPDTTTLDPAEPPASETPGISSDDPEATTTPNPTDTPASDTPDTPPADPEVAVASEPDEGDSESDEQES